MKIPDFLKRLLHIQEDISSSENNKIPHGGTEDSDANQPAPENDGISCSTAGNGWENVVEYLQIGFYEFTMEKGVIGFCLDPENRWIQLGREVFSSVAGAETFYEKRLRKMRADTKGSRLKAKLEKLKQDKDVEAYGARLALPNLDAARNTPEYRSEKETADDTPAGSMQDETTVQPEASDESGSHPAGNVGTLILDATCGPTSIRYPQDFSLLNEGRVDLEKIINRLCHDYGIEKPGTYVRMIRKEARKLAKSKKKSEDQIRHVILLELNAIKRNLEYIDRFLSREKPVELTPNEVERIQVIRMVHARQRYMYELKTHRVTNRIVSISQPFVRPISRGKVDTPTEFGPKYDIAVNENGFSWITSFSFDNFSESTHLQEAVEDYRKKTGHYPERVLADQIYRTRDNRKYCKGNGIRLSGPALGRKPGNEDTLQERIAVEKKDMVDRISVERHFSRQKRCFGISEIVEKTEATIGHAVGMAVFLDNVVPVDF